MDLNDIVWRHLDRRRMIVALGEHTVDLQEHLRVPDYVRYEERGGDAISGHELGADTLVISFVVSTPHAPDGLSSLLAALQPGARAIFVTPWPTEELLDDPLSGPLADGGAQVIDAVPLDDPIDGAQCAIVAERVVKLAPVLARSADSPGLGGMALGQLPAVGGTANGAIAADASAGGRPTGVSTVAADDLPTALRAANGYMLADMAARMLRRRLRDLKEAEAGRLAAEARIAALERQLGRQNAEIRKLRGALTKIESSIRLRIGTMAVKTIKHPLRAAVDVPEQLLQMRQLRRGRRREAVKGKITVPLALPALDGLGSRSALTMTVPPALFVPKRLRKLGLAGYEESALACFLAALEGAGSGAVLDIGANVGIYAGLASSMSNRVVRAFEPMPMLATEARNFAKENELGFETESIALGATNGNATFYLSDSTDSSNSLAAGFRKSSHQIEVKVETLDSYVARTKLLPAVMKVDTETTEPDVLVGAAETIARHRPWILCEVLAGRSEERLNEVMAPFGYHWYHITDEVPYREMTQIVGDPTYDHLMWLFAPEPPSDQFWSTVRAATKALAECTPARGAALIGR